ncbi:hypothetical protein [Nocardiopsis alba]|uniref:Uncharacterized protein n=1 Tax=Nocardiopsis alba TaxID=53437 RepID=A0A7K2J0T7_9ACTN|nr:hypothetical protein [Nocardiopsis alba]MYR30710.1 hypothetical protein [Nocardiopsis alba]MYR35736.1 hypothetical protein [Nocardiopsis alba]
MSTVSRPEAGRPSAALLWDVFAVLDRHGYERAPGRDLCAALPRLDSLLVALADAYEGREVADV